MDGSAMVNREHTVWKTATLIKDDKIKSVW